MIMYIPLLLPWQLYQGSYTLVLYFKLYCALLSADDSTPSYTHSDCIQLWAVLTPVDPCSWTVVNSERMGKGTKYSLRHDFFNSIHLEERKKMQYRNEYCSLSCTWLQMRAWCDQNNCSNDNLSLSTAFRRQAVTRTHNPHLTPPESDCRNEDRKCRRSTALDFHYLQDLQVSRPCFITQSDTRCIGRRKASRKANQKAGPYRQ